MDDGREPYEFSIASALPAVAAYAILATILFGGMVKPLGLVTIWAGNMAWPWRPLAFASVALSAYVCFYKAPRRIDAGWRPTMFVIMAMVLSVVLVGAYAEVTRTMATRKLAPDLFVKRSFLQSLRSSPSEHQADMHAAAMKRCVLYGWSYRTMSFYPTEAGGSMPRIWYGKCPRRASS